MKLRLISASILLAGILIVLAVNIAYAQWAAIKDSGYAITTDWHGETVPFGERVTAWAGTTNSSVYKVEFEWLNETDHVIFEENITNLVSYTTPSVPLGVPQEIIDWADKYPNYTILYANSSQIPNSIGNWTVKAYFYALGGHVRGPETNIVKMRATSLHTVPDIPVVGTAGAVAAMLLGLGLFWHKKKK